MPSIDAGVRPTTKVVRQLDWQAPGRNLTPETRWFQTSGASLDFTAAGTFEIVPAAGECILVASITFLVTDSGTWSDTTFGSQTAYTTGNGPIVTLRKAGAQVHDFTADIEITSNRTLLYNCDLYERTSWDSGNDTSRAVIDLVGSKGPVLLDATDDSLRIVTGATMSVVQFLVRADCTTPI